MDDIRSQNNIIQDISLLYELSLSIGSSIELKENCHGFIKTLMARKNLELASVWVKKKYLGETPEDTFRLVYASPISRIESKEIEVSHPILSIIKKKESIVLRKNDPGFDDIITEKFIREGSYAIFKLGKFGFLKLFTSTRSSILTDRELHQLQNVIRKFSISVEGCLSNITAIKEYEEIKLLEERARILAKFPEENPNPVMRVLKDGKLNYANKASEIILKFWNVTIGSILPDEILKTIKDVSTKQIGREIEVDCGSQIFSLTFEPILNSKFINIYGLDITQRVHAKNELQDLKTFYEQTLHDLPGQIAVFDTELRYLYVNPQSVANEDVRLWLIGKDDYEFCQRVGLSPAIAEQRQRKLKQAMKERKPIRFEERMVKPSGEVFDFLRLVSPVINDKNEITKLIAYGVDITNRKRAEESLKISEEKYRSIFESIHDVYAEVDIIDGTISEMSPSIMQVAGFKRDEIIGQPMSKFYAEPEKREQLLHELLKTGSLTDYEVNLFNKDGVKVATSFSVKVVYDEEGKPLKIVGTMRDISERKRSEKALIEKEEKYRLLLEHSGSAINYFDRAGNFILANFISAKNLGRTPGELIGKSMYDVLPRQIAILSRKRFERIIKTGKGAEFEDLMELPGGKRWFSSSLQPVKDNDGEIIGIQTIANDITERKLAEQELIETNLQNIQYAKELRKTVRNLKQSEKKLSNSQEQLSSVLNTVGEGIITFDSMKQIILVNTEAEKMFGYEPGELNGKKFDILLCEKCKERIGEVIDMYLSGGKNDEFSKRVESEGVRNGGNHFPMEIKVTETKIDDKSYFTAAVHDISDLHLLVKDLERSNRALSEFAYIASHDLREPLRKIVSFGNLLHESLADRLDEDNHENLLFMIDGAKRMHQMVDDLLSYSRLTSKKIEFQKINLNELVDGLIHFELAVLIDEANAVIEIENKLGYINGEPAQIKQLLQNLIENGIKYRKKDVPPIIKVRSLRQNGSTLVEIEDNGIGIASDYQSQIFEMFKRLHSREKYSGSGIGLAVCKKIIDLHNGEIGVKSELNNYSTFWFKLSQNT